MHTAPTFYRPNTDKTSAAYVRFALALCGYEAGAVRVRAVTNKYRELGESGALRWAFDKTALEVARDIRALSAVFAYTLADLRKVIVNSDNAERLRIHDAAVATLTEQVAA